MNVGIYGMRNPISLWAKSPVKGKGLINVRERERLSPIVSSLLSPFSQTAKHQNSDWRERGRESKSHHHSPNWVFGEAGAGGGNGKSLCQ